MFDYRINTPDVRPPSAYEIAQRARAHEKERIRFLAEHRGDEGTNTRERSSRSPNFIYNLLAGLGLL